MVAHLGIVYTRIEEGVLEAEMLVDARTHQPFGLLHGGASAALAETLGSMAGWLMTEEGSAWWGPSSTPPITGRSPAAKSAANAGRCISDVRARAGKLRYSTSEDGAAAPAVWARRSSAEA